MVGWIGGEDLHVEVAPVFDLEVAQGTVVFTEIFEIINHNGSVEDELSSSVERLKLRRAVEIAQRLKVRPLGRDLIGVIVQLVLPELIQLRVVKILAPLADAERNGREVASILRVARSRGIRIRALLLGHVLVLGTVERRGHGISTGETTEGLAALTTISAHEVAPVSVGGGEK